MVQWFGVAAPAGLSRTLVTKINQELITILSHTEARAALIKQGLVPVGNTPDEFGAYIKSELEKWTRVFREMGLQGEQLR